MLLATLFATASPGSPSLRSLEARVAELTEQVQTLKDASAHDELTKTFVQGDGDHDGMLSLREFSKMHSAGVFNFERKLAHRPSIDEALGNLDTQLSEHLVDNGKQSRALALRSDGAVASLERRGWLANIHKYLRKPHV